MTQSHQPLVLLDHTALLENSVVYGNMIQDIMDYYLQEDVCFADWFTNLAKAKAIIMAAPEDRICLNFYRAQNESLITPTNECGTLFCNYGWISRAPYFASKGFGLAPSANSNSPSRLYHSDLSIPVDSRLPKQDADQEHLAWEAMVARTFGPSASETLFGSHPDAFELESEAEMLKTEGHKQLALERYDYHYTMLVNARDRLLRQQGATA